MLKEERHSVILHELRAFERVRSTKLSRLLSVSEDTIRRDLMELEEGGQLKKVHGGAISLSFIPSFKKREVIEIEKKYELAKKALCLLEDGMVLIVDGGTSNLQLVNLLPQDKKLTIFTNSIPVASKLCEYPNVDGILLGGNILKKGFTTIGNQALEPLSEVQADLCFLGITSIDIASGLTEANRQETSIKKAFIKSSSRVATLTISSKINTKQPFRVCSIDCLDVMITELCENDEKLSAFKNKGIKVI
jgi:DeoR family fructose operon transcriptional repressor